MEKIILGVIPARGGSKRIPKKNIKILNGKPLIFYTINAANDATFLDDYIVSTENKEIGKIVDKFGVRVLQRPKTLATDWTKTVDVILDVLNHEYCDIVVCLQPTSPFRTGEDIDNAIKLFLKNKCESVISVCEAGKNHTWLLKTSGRYLTPAFGHKYFGNVRLPKMYVPNGAIYISTPSVLRKYKTFYTKKILPYVMPAKRSIDIDSKVDFGIAEAMIKQ